MFAEVKLAFVCYNPTLLFEDLRENQSSVHSYTRRRRGIVIGGQEKGRHVAPILVVSDRKNRIAVTRESWNPIEIYF